MRSLLARLLDSVRRRSLDRELDDELAVHLELAARDKQVKGMTRVAAERAALREFGGVSKAKEADREVRGFQSLEHLWADVRHGLRVLLKQPTFTAAAVLTLALGIGSTTAIFSVVYGVLLRPLPFDEPDRLVVLLHHAPGFNTPRLPQNAATYFTYRDNARVFEDIGLWRAEEVSVTRDGTPEPEAGLRATGGLLSLLRVQPSIGRLLREEDDVPGAPNRVLLTYSYWQRAFGASRDVVGQ